MPELAQTLTSSNVQTVKHLKELGRELPPVPAPVASYVPAVRSGNMLFTSGQLPLRAGSLIVSGKVGAEITPEEAAELAAVCTLNALAAAAQFGDLDHARILKVVGYVASAPGFTSQPSVMTGASDLILQVFGERGHHARSAVGVAELPLGAPVEVELVMAFPSTDSPTTCCS